MSGMSWELDDSSKTNLSLEFWIMIINLRLGFWVWGSRILGFGRVLGTKSHRFVFHLSISGHFSNKLCNVMHGAIGL